MVKREDLVEEYCPHCESDTYHYYKEGRGWVCVSCNRVGDECLISTIVCMSTGLPHDCKELATLRSFRDTYMAETEERRELVGDYYRHAPGIVRTLMTSPRKLQLCQTLYEQYVVGAVDHIESGSNEIALYVYSEMIRYLQRELGDDRI